MNLCVPVSLMSIHGWNLPDAEGTPLRPKTKKEGGDA
jgi:hypothetical protein